MTRSALLGVLASLTLLAAACTSGDSAGSEVRAFRDVQASDISFEIDPDDPGRAIFRVTTTIPMICSITWGETDALGNQNNSLSMNGTGIEQHDVILPGAQPGVEYFFTVQGADAEGNLYRSDLLTVTIPDSGSAVFPIGADAFDLSTDGGPDPDAAPVTTDPRASGENLAEGATVSGVSSEFSDSFAAALAVDGDLTTEWSSAGDGDDAWIEIDLGSPQPIAGVEFLTRSMADRTAITASYTVTVDGGVEFGPFDAGNARAGVFAPLDVTGQIVRFDVETSSGGNTGAVEIRVVAPG